MKIHTGLDQCLRLNGIETISPLAITGHLNGTRIPDYQVIEAMAQLGALHVRHIIQYDRHAFLMAVNQCAVCVTDPVTGLICIKGSLQSRSSRAFVYGLTARLESKKIIQGTFVFATTDYNDLFQKHILKPHYERLLSCLRSDTQAP